MATIRYFQGLNPVTIELGAGNILPLETSATGHVFLSWSHEALIPKDIAKKRSTKAIIKRTVDAGYGWVDGDLLPRIAAISAPVFDNDSRLVLALTVLG